MSQRLEFQILLSVHKALNGLGAKYIQDTLVPYETSRPHRLIKCFQTQNEIKGSSWNLLKLSLPFKSAHSCFSWITSLNVSCFYVGIFSWFPFIFIIYSSSLFICLCKTRLIFLVYDLCTRHNQNLIGEADESFITVDFWHAKSEQGAGTMFVLYWCAGKVGRLHMSTVTTLCSIVWWWWSWSHMPAANCTTLDSR